MYVILVITICRPFLDSDRMFGVEDTSTLWHSFEILIKLVLKKYLKKMRLFFFRSTCCCHCWKRLLHNRSMMSLYFRPTITLNKTTPLNFSPSLELVPFKFVFSITMLLTIPPTYPITWENNISEEWRFQSCLIFILSDNFLVIRF